MSSQKRLFMVPDFERVALDFILKKKIIEFPFSPPPLEDMMSLLSKF